MKALLSLPLLLLIAVGCSPENAGPPVAGPDAATKARTASREAPAPLPVGNCDAGSGYAYLPEGVHFPFKHHLRSDRYVENRQGGTHRRVILEYLEGDAATIGAQAKAALVDAGFRHIDDAETNHGGTRSRFHRNGNGMVVLSVFPDPGATPANPRALGTVMVEFSP
jgi:hypothetical protein